MKYLKIIYLIVIVVILTNYVFPFRVIVGMVFSSPNLHVDYFTYSTAHGEFRSFEEPLKGPQFKDMVNISFEYYKKCHPMSPDTILYRTFRKNAWEFWNWGLFISDDRFKLEYLSPESIKPLPYKVKSICN